MKVVINIGEWNPTSKMTVKKVPDFFGIPRLGGVGVGGGGVTVRMERLFCFVYLVHIPYGC